MKIDKIPARSRMKKHFTPENILLVLYMVSRYHRSCAKIPSRKQLFEFSQWEEFISSTADLPERIQLDLEMKVETSRLTKLLSSSARRCVLFVYFEFIDHRYDSDRFLDLNLIEWYPHLRNYTENAEFTSTLVARIDPSETHCFQLFIQFDPPNKNLFAMKLYEYYKGVYT